MNLFKEGDFVTLNLEGQKQLWGYHWPDVMVVKKHNMGYLCVFANNGVTHCSFDLNSSQWFEHTIQFEEEYV